MKMPWFSPAGNWDGASANPEAPSLSEPVAGRLLSARGSKEARGGVMTEVLSALSSTRVTGWPGRSLVLVYTYG